MSARFEAVALKKLQEIIQEKSHGSKKVDSDWVKDGKITFDAVDLRYRKNTEIALDKLSFDVEGGQKVGICGRTGAGKSSLTLALFRIILKDKKPIQKSTNM